MIKLLIVEDEREIRRGIMSSIPWEANGISLCGEAENGKEALSLLEKLSPDILLLDIRMPVMNGLQVLEALSANNSAVKSIILSGYDDFSYVQKALRLGASDYLLKPCDPDEMLETVLKVKKLLENEIKKKDILARLKIQLNESLPFLKEKYLLKLIKGGALNLDTIRNNFELYQIKLSTESVSVVVLDIDDYYLFSEQNSNETTELYRFAMKNIADEVLSPRFRTEIFDDNERIILLVSTDDIEYQGLLEELLTTVKANVKNNLDLTISFGIGNRYEDILSIHKSYTEALKSIEVKFFTGKDHIIKYCDIQAYDTDEISYPLNEEQEIISSIKSGNMMELEYKLDAFFAALNPQSQKKEFILQSGLALTLTLYHFCIEKNVEKESIFGSGFTTLEKIQRLDSLEQLKSALLQAIRSIAEKINSRKCSNKVVELALKYLDKNFTRDLSLEAVAHEVFISPSYLSLLFKQTQGINFIDYLHKLRIDKACEILKDPRIKAADAAQKVGYNEERYFYQIFKKITGMTPTQYKSSL